MKASSMCLLASALLASVWIPFASARQEGGAAPTETERVAQEPEEPAPPVAQEPVAQEPVAQEPVAQEPVEPAVERPAGRRRPGQQGSGQQGGQAPEGAGGRRGGFPGGRGGFAGRTGPGGRQRPQAATVPGEGAKLPQEWFDQLEWRSIGPATMGGRITALAVYEADPVIWWAATASGGLLKTNNDGRTFEHQFDREAVASIGDVAVAPSDPEIVWVGTGESNPRNSVSWGNGVYKSTDGGKTWKNMGLEQSYQIGAVVIHPSDPNVVYVGALGRLWGESEERGLYKTSDGGETWERVLYVDERTGVVDVDLMPGQPDTLLVATYERARDGFDTNDPAKRWGPGSALWKSTDAGASFQKLSEGLPSSELGRIEVDYYRSDPSVVFALIESSRIGQEPEDAPFAGLSSTDADVGARLTEVAEDGPAAEAGLKLDDIVIRLGGETVQSSSDLTAKIRRHLAGETVQVEVSRERKSVTLDLTFARHPRSVEDSPRGEGAEGGEQVAEASEGTSESEAESSEPEPRKPFSGSLGGQVANVQEQQGPEGHEYGGLYQSTDGGETWARINSINPRPMYFSQLRVDPLDATHIYVPGVPLFRSVDGGETFTDDGHPGDVHVDHHALWIDPRDSRHAILGNDGGIYVTRDRFETWDHLNHVAIGQFYHVAVGPRPDYNVYGGLQDNGSWGGPARVRDGRGALNEDWLSIGGGDGFICRVDPTEPDLVYFESQNGSLGRRNLRTGERGSMRPRAPRGTRYRWNWKTPFILSSHNSGIYYTAGNYVFRSWLRGDNLEAISPEITNTDKGSATALAESPLDAGVLYVGSDDGALWGTRNGGQSWTNLFVPAGPQAEAEPASVAVEAAFEGEVQNTFRGGPAADAQEPGEAPAGGRSRGRIQGQEPAAEDPVTGRWVVRAEEQPEARGGARAPGGRRPGGDQPDTEVVLKLGEGGSLSGSLSTPWSDMELSSGSWDAQTGQLKLAFSGEGGFDVSFEGTLSEGVMSGMLDYGGRFQRELEARREVEGARGRDDGHEWKPLGELVPEPLWVSALETSAFAAARVYMTLDGHRSDRDEPFVYVSEDHGSTWRPLTGDLPASAGSARTIREDLVNPDVLYLGTEFGAWVTIDRGAHWTRMHSNLPTVAVHEFAQHPTNGELVAATHGRSLWVLDVTPLRQFTAEALEGEAMLYEPNAVTFWRSEPRKGGTLRRFEGTNPTSDAQIFYSLARDVRDLALVVKRPSGEVLAELEAPTSAGLHRVAWNLRPTSERRSSQGRRGGRGGPRLEPGTYVVELRSGGRTQSRQLQVRGDPSYPETVLWGEEYDRQLELEQELMHPGRRER